MLFRIEKVMYESVRALTVSVFGLDGSVVRTFGSRGSGDVHSKFATVRSSEPSLLLLLSLFRQITTTYVMR